MGIMRVVRSFSKANESFHEKRGVMALAVTRPANHGDMSGRF